jgi:tetratricopeptide (TPR) repeat protein
MSTEALLDLIKQKYSPGDGQTLIHSLVQDPLIWHFVNNEEQSLAYFEKLSDIVVNYSPGSIALWQINQITNESVFDLKNFDTKLPLSLRQRAARAFETVINTGLPPSDLLTAGLLALTLRERRVLKGSWVGIAEDIFFKSDRQSTQKNFEIWRTPTSILFDYCNDFDAFIGDFFLSKSLPVAKTGIAIFVHSLLSNPLTNLELEDKLFNLTQNLHIDLQLECLKWVEKYHLSELTKSLSRHLMQTKSNIDFFARIFSELEILETKTSNTDPIDKTARFSLAEDVNRLAAFYFLGGEKKKASEMYQRASQLLDFFRSQTLIQAINCDEKDPKSQLLWGQIIKTIPLSKQARLFYIRSLINQHHYEEALKHLVDIPDSPEKNFLLMQIQYAQGKIPKEYQDMKPLVPINRNSSLPQVSSFFVTDTKLNTKEDLLKFVIHNDINTLDSSWVETILSSEQNNFEMIELARDYLERTKNIKRAIELTALLERAKPSDKKQKQALSRLYCLSERWEEAFRELQLLVKTESAPDIEDLVNFAKSALKTDHVDIAISICQNILKQEKFNIKALILLGESYAEKGDFVKAIQHMEQVVEMIPDDGETWLALAKIWSQNGQTDRAFEILNKGVIALPNEPKLLRALGKSHLDKQAPADALIYLKKAYELEPNHVSGRLDLAKAKFKLGQFEESWQLLEIEMDNYESNPEIAKLLGNVLLAMEDEKAAKPVLLFAADQNPGDVETVLTVSKLVLTEEENLLGDKNLNILEKLGAILAKALLYDPDNTEIKINIADVDRLSGRFQDALDAYSQLSDIESPEDSKLKWRLAYGLGKAAIKLGNTDLALAALQEANVKKSGNLMVLHALSEAYQLNQLSEKARRTAKSALITAPQNISNILWYANFKIENNEPEEAVKALREALEINPDRTELIIWLAKTLISTKSNEESLKIIEALLSGSKATANELHQAAYIGIELNRADLAVQALEKSVNLTNDFELTKMLDLIAAYALNGQITLALDTIELNRLRFPENPQFVMLKSDLLESLGQYDLAYQALMDINIENGLNFKQTDHDIETIQQSPLLYSCNFSQEFFYYRIGKLARALGNILEAQEYFTKANNTNSEDLGLKNALIESLIVGLKFDNAIAFYEAQPEANKNIENYESERLFTNYIEALINIEAYQKAEDAIRKLSGLHDASVRVQALHSCLTALSGDLILAESLLISATTQNNKESENPTSSLENIFMKTLTLDAFAEAFTHIENYHDALDYHRCIDELLAKQPLYCLNYAKTLIKRAELQQIGERLSIIKHAPGKSALSEETQKKCKQLVGIIQEHLPQNKLMCLKARMVAAFTGQWPLSLNADLCLGSPDSAAAILISTDSEMLAQEILETFPDHIKVLQAFGIYAMKNNSHTGSAYVEKAINLNPSDPINHALLAFLIPNEPLESAKLLETALELWPDEAEWHMLVSEMFDQIGDVDSAARHITQALSTNPENAKYWERSGEIKLRLNNFSGARNDIEKSATLQSNDPDIWIKMAKVNRQIGNAPEALENIRKASSLDPENYDIHIQEIKLLLDQKNFQEAENKAKQLLNADPSNVQLRVFLAQARAKQGKTEEALLVLQNQVGHKDPKIDLEILKIKKDQEGIEKLLPELIELADTNPQNPEVLTTLTDWLIQSNRLKKAEETAQTVLRIIPQQAEVHLMLGRLQRKNGQLDQAIAHLSDAITYDPLLVEAYIELGKTYQDRRNLEDAIKIFQKGAQTNPSDARPYYYAAMALKEIKNYTDAEIMLKEAKKCDPDDPHIIRQLGVITALNLIHKLREPR